jgi:serine phosphatase RsbU (regulator of sigma subunit)
VNGASGGAARGGARNAVDRGYTAVVPSDPATEPPAELHRPFMTSARIEIEEDGHCQTVAVDKERFTIGRQVDNDLSLEAYYVSRHHAEIVRSGERFLIRDLGSRYGTFVNGERAGERLLASGDSIRLGPSPETQFVFRFEAAAAPGPSTMTLPGAQPFSGELRRVTRVLEGLRAAGSGRVLEEVLAIVLDCAIELIDVERGFIMLANAGGELEFKLARERGGRPLAGEGIVTSRLIPQRVFATGEAQLVQDLDLPERQAEHQQTIAAGIRAAICVPLRLGRSLDAGSPRAEMHTIGVLYVDSRWRSQFISRASRAALEALADQAALAIENARLYAEAMAKARLEQDMQRAAEMQLSLLPARTRVAGPFEVAGDTLPSRLVGGDFFDYFDAADGRLVFAVADVCGKGLPAAILAAQAQGIFASWAEATHSPALVMKQVNRTLARRALSASFVTMVCGMLTPDGRLLSCNAGHNLPLVLRRDGSVESLNGGGLMLGPFADAEYDEESILLWPGDAVVIYSDGVTDRTNSVREHFGDQRVRSLLAECAGGSASAILERVRGAVDAFAGATTQGDDITLLVVRYRGTDSVTRSGSAGG